MSSPLPSIILGVLAAILGVLAIQQWWPAVLDVLKGGFALSLLCGGLVAVAAGISRYTMRGEDRSPPQHRTRREDTKAE